MSDKQSPGRSIIPAIPTLQAELVSDPVGGKLAIGINSDGDIELRFPEFRGTPVVVFTPRQAKALARLLNEKASDAERKPYNTDSTASGRDIGSIIKNMERFLSDDY